MYKCRYFRWLGALKAGGIRHDVTSFLMEGRLEKDSLRRRHLRGDLTEMTEWAGWVTEHERFRQKEQECQSPGANLPSLPCEPEQGGHHGPGPGEKGVRIRSEESLGARSCGACER